MDIINQNSKEVTFKEFECAYKILNKIKDEQDKKYDFRTSVNRNYIDIRFLKDAKNRN